MPIVVAVLAAWSCSSRDELQSEQERVPIRLATSLDGTGSRTTRAGTTNNVTQSTEFLAGQYVDAYIKVKGGDWLTGLSATTPRHFQVNTTDTNSDGIVDGDLDRKSGEAMDYYPMDATPVTIYAVHPSVASAAAFTVSNDQTDADNYAASDLCYSKTADYNRTEAKQTLRFKHVLSKIVVNVDVSELGTPAVTNLKLRAKTQTSITYPNPSDATNDYQIGSASNVDYIKMNVGGAAIIPPQKTSAVGDVLITFDVAGVGPIAYKFPANTTFASNTQYIYTVKVGGTISVTSTITDWDAGTYSPGDELVMTKNIKMNPLWYVAKYNISANSLTMGTVPNSGEYFTWNAAMVMFSDTKSAVAYDDYRTGGLTIANSNDNYTYHLPVAAEWQSIIPTTEIVQNQRETIIDFSGLRTSTIVTKFGFNDYTKNTGIWDVSYWVKKSSTEIHAIRYLGTMFCSAWKYVMSGNQQTIYATLIDPIGPEDAADFYTNNWSSISFDENESPFAVRRDFYNRGYKSGGTVASVAYTHFWSASTSVFNDDYKMQSYIGSNNFICYGYGPVSAGTSFCVRLFRDN